MRVLLDENIDRLLKPLFESNFEVITVRERGWHGKKNGTLLRAAEEEFDVFVTMDKNLPHQQNLKVLRVAVVVICAPSNTFAHIAPLMAKVNTAIKGAINGTAIYVEA